MGALAMLASAASAAWLWDDASAPWRWGSIAAWALCLCVLLPPAWRMLARRSLYLDPLWCIVGLLALNRESFLLRISATGSHATALLLALAMAGMSWSYQRVDRKVPR